MGHFELADHSIELSTRNVIVTEWTGLKIRCSVDMLRLLSDWARQVQVQYYGSDTSDNPVTRW
jgi:hypothetical protein